MIGKRRTRIALPAATVAATAIVALMSAGAASAATYTATNNATLASAIASANANPGANTIIVDAFSYTPATTMEITNGPLTIQGPAPTPNANGAEAKIAGTGITSPAPNGPVFVIDPGVTVNFDDIEVTAGGEAGSPLIDDSGIANLSQVGIGGATGPQLQVENGATATVTNSTIANGLSTGIIDFGTLNLVNSTVSGNHGGIANNAATLNLTNSIVAENTTGGNHDCQVAATSSDASLDSDGSCDVAAPLSGVNPRLGSVLPNGGTTLTAVPSIALSSPAIGAADASACPAVDERGAARPSGGPCDIGAVQTDTVVPVFTTGNLTVGDQGTSAIPVNYTPTWTDAGSPVTSTCTPASGSSFALGVNTVTCSGTDVFGNHAAGQTFTITVIEYADPVVTTTPSGTDTVAAVDATGADVTFTASATDAVDGTIPATCDHASGSKFPLGTTTVTCSATDSGSETGQTTLTVDVVDQTPPVITVPSDVTVVGPTGTVVNYSPAPSATDNVDGTDPVMCTPASGAAFVTGTTTVSCSASDAAGNTATKTFTVTVAAVGADHTNETVQGEIASQLSITATTADFGTIIPAITHTYGTNAVATVTSTDSSTQLTIADTNTSATSGHLLNVVSGKTYELASPLQVNATSSSPLASFPVGNPFQAVSATPYQLLSYSGPVTSDPVTLSYQQPVAASESLHNGTYSAVMILQLTGTP